MFKVARVQEHLGVGVWGHIYPGWQKAWRYVKVFTFVFLAWWRSLRIKKTARIILHSKTILTNWKCREETFFKFFFQEESYCDPGEGDTPYIMALYHAGGSALKVYCFKYMKKYMDFTGWSKWKGREICHFDL